MWELLLIGSPQAAATLTELRLAVGVILNLMISTNLFLPIILLRVTPSANRNTYSVATPYYIYTQGRGAARLNPGLGNRNSYRVAAGCELYPHLATCVLLNYSNLRFHPHHHPHAYTYTQLHPHHHTHAYTYPQLRPHHHPHAYTTPHGGIVRPYSCKNGDEKKWGK